MNKTLKILFMATTLSLPMSFAFSQGLSQQIPEPTIGTVPSGPSDAQSTHDEVSIEQLLKLVDLTRTVGGSLSDLYQKVVNQTTALEKIQNAQLGKKDVPLHDSEDELRARGGGPGLREMAQGALDGNLVAPDGVKQALDNFRPDFDLDKAFALKDDKSRSLAFAAQTTAQGAIASATAEESYKRANSSMARLENYILALQDSNDLKTSVDLNTRVMIEVAQQINESLRTDAAIASVAGAYLMTLGGEAGQEGILEGLKNFNR
ncbi:type IV secretion system protein [Ochrobactrum sp. BTU1]|uniref:type IV secretion system protein n=1 Tax=Ochrobactrum sp. BTU1 TaxID=2840456 RepID=UPI001C05A5A2|nr:hypothetical protein KMS41_23240 [Ochrobactrum sp. BTU1]